MMEFNRGIIGKTTDAKWIEATDAIDSVDKRVAIMHFIPRGWV
jgi:hypothetical protein